MRDVIIVGAGPAGTRCAKLLAEEGVDVVVYERRNEIGSPKRCGEGLDEKAEELIGKIPERCIANKVIGAMVYAPNGKSIEVKGDGYILERKVFDKWMAIEAAKSGAEVRSGTDIHNLIIENGYVKGVKGKFIGEDFEERAKVVVAAVGAESKLPREAGVNTACDVQLVDTCLQFEMANVKSDQRFIHIYLGKEIAPRGYAWIFPKGNETANVGLGILPVGTKGERPIDYLNKFINKNDELNKASIIEVNAGVVPVGGLVKEMVSNGFVVCGEAAHHVNPIHGGGIKEAMISGEIAANVVKKALKENNFSKEFLSEFDKTWWKERGEKLRRIEKMREVFEKMEDKDFNELVEIFKPEDILAVSNGDLITVLKIIAKNPKLIKYAKFLK